MPNSALLYSAGDDGQLCIWDVAAETPSRIIKDAHADHIRASAAMKGSGLIVTGSYDQLVRVWDLRSNKVSSFVPY